MYPSTPGRLGHNEAMPKISQHDVISSLVSQGRLSEVEAERIRTAPRFVIQVRELVSYLGGLIILVGVVRLIAAVLEDASKMAIAGVLYAVAVVLGLVAWRFVRRTGPWGRFGEVLELGSLSALGVALGLSLNEAGTSSEVAALTVGVLVTLWGALRVRFTQFGATFMLGIGIMIFATALSSLLDLDEEVSALPILIGGLIVLALGTQRIRLAIVLRAAGSVVALFTTIAWMGMREGLDGLLLGLIVGGGVFALGATRMWIEVILPSGILIVVSVAMYVFRNVDNDVLQGLIVVAVGLAMLGATALVLRRKRAVSVGTT